LTTTLEPQLGESYDAFIRRAKANKPDFDAVAWWLEGGRKTAPRSGPGWSVARADLTQRAAAIPPTIVAEAPDDQPTPDATMEPVQAVIITPSDPVPAVIITPPPVIEPILQQPLKEEPTSRAEPDAPIIPAEAETEDAFKLRLEQKGLDLVTWLRGVPALLASGILPAGRLEGWPSAVARTGEDKAEASATEGAPS
jgi:hypothetical protein